MPHKSPLPSLPAVITALSAAATTGIVAAASLGSSLSMPVLGQPLDFSVQMRTEPGDGIVLDCLSAEVMVGERQLPPSLVRTLAEPTGPDRVRVRVTSGQAIDEPVVTVTVTAGCSSRISRHYVLLVDPPMTVPVVAAPAFAADPAPVPTGAGGLAADPAPSAATAEPGAPSASSRAGTSAAAPASAPRVAAPPRRAAAADAPVRRSTVARAAAAPRPEATRRPSRVVPPPPAAPVAAAPRLRLELQEPAPGAAAQAVEDALQAVAQAASAARAAASAASAANERIVALERTVEQLRGEARTQRDLATQLREQLAHNESAGRWFAPLLALLLILSGAVAWLGWRLAAAQRQRGSDWRQAMGPVHASAPEPTAAGKQATAPIPFVTGEATGAPGGRTAPAWPPPAPVPDAWMPSVSPDSAQSPAPAPTESAAQRTQPLPGGAGSARDVSIEELIDLEQQAEFFVVLGQDEAAIDLLIEHLRNTGGGSPLPYLKLLEIYRRREDRDAYERMRVRFNRRFNAYAPEWAVDLTHGRTLEDYVGVVPRLQQVWARPAEAMAELEALLFRKSRGELFDLPAYREVLLLYSLARDLLDRETLDSGNVDLLLPLSDGGESGGTAAPMYRVVDGGSAPPGRAQAGLTAPLDLDIGRGDPPASLFDSLADPPRSQRS